LESKVIAKVAPRALAVLFFVALACTGVAGFAEHEARVHWQQVRSLQGEPSYDAEASDRRYEKVDIWRARRVLSFRATTFLGVALATLSLRDRRRRLRG